jgi:hypothetical protein
VGSPSELALLREALEKAIGRERATSALFVALDASPGGVPKSRETWLAFIAGPLRDALAGSETDVDRVVEQVGAAIGSEAGEVAFDVDVDSGEPSETLFMPTSGHKPVPVLTVAGSDALALRLVAVLGNDRVKPTWVADEAALRKATFAAQPLLVLVDGADPPSMDPSALASALGATPDTVVRVLWASDLAGGHTIADALATAGVEHTHLPRREGVEPLLDLILSRLD